MQSYDECISIGVVKRNAMGERVRFLFTMHVVRPRIKCNQVFLDVAILAPIFFRGSQAVRATDRVKYTTAGNAKK